MAQHTGVIEAISHKYDKFAVLVDGNWFNTKAEYAKEWPVQPAVGDEISWNDGGKKYLGKMKIVKKNTAAPAAGGNVKAGNYNVGVEVGHASKLAMDMALACPALVVGSPEFYKFWAEETLKIHNMMTKLKAKVAAGSEPKPEPTPEEERIQVITKTKKVEEPELDTDDLF